MLPFIQKNHPQLSISHQCSLLGINRSTFYYTPVAEEALNLELMRLMDEHYLLHPYKGVPRMYVWLTRDKGYQINIKRIERLYYDLMGLRAI
ncbi:MAG: transposase [Saprospiraceae bacterium]|nr:transposase [Saprospiraceae bacterium]